MLNARCGRLFKINEDELGHKDKDEDASRSEPKLGNHDMMIRPSQDVGRRKHEFILIRYATGKGTRLDGEGSER